MASASSCGAMSANVVMSVVSRVVGLQVLCRQRGELVLEVEDLLKLEEAGVGLCVAEVDEELRHLGLPACVDLGGGHAGLGRRERGRLDVADEQPVGTQEERVV